MQLATSQSGTGIKGSAVLVNGTGSLQRGVIRAAQCMGPDGGIRFHRGASAEVADAIQTFGQARHLLSEASTTLSYQPGMKRSVSAQAQSAAHNAPLSDGSRFSGTATTREQYGYSSRHASGREADFALTLVRQAHEAQARQWGGHGTVRTLRVGSYFSLTQSTFDADLSELTQRQLKPEFAVLGVTQVGVNNLPKATQESLTVLFGEAVDWLTEADLPAEDLWPTGPAEDAELLRTARSTGFACRFVALHREQLFTPMFVPERAKVLMSHRHRNESTRLFQLASRVK